MTGARTAGLLLALALALAPLTARAVARQEPAAAVEPQPPPVESPDQLAVRAVFDAYKRALVEGDGDTAVALVDRATLEYWAELRRLALSGSEQEVGERSFIERLLVVSVRHEVPPEQLQELELSGLIRMAVEAGWIGEGSILQLEMGEITLDGDEARGRALTGASAGLDPVDGLDYRFVREAGSWRFSFVSLVQGLDRVISELTSQLGTDEDDLIFMLVESFSGRKVLPEVWQPPAATQEEETQEPPG